MNNPYDNDEVKQLQFKLGHIGEQIVREEINRFDGYSTVKAEYACPDYKIFINDKLAGFAEIKVQQARNILNDGRKIGYSFPCATIDNYRKFNAPETPLEFYVVDPAAGLVRWDYFNELEREREIDGAIFPFDKYAKFFNADTHHWHIKQFRYSFNINGIDIAELLSIINERDKLVKQLQTDKVDSYREKRMLSYVCNKPIYVEDAPF